MAAPLTKAQKSTTSYLTGALSHERSIIIAGHMTGVDSVYKTLSWLTTGRLIIITQTGVELTGTERIAGSAVDNYWAIKTHTRNPRRAENT